MNQKTTYQISLFKKENRNTISLQKKTIISLQVKADPETAQMWKMHEYASTNKELPVRIFNGNFSWRESKEQARRDMERRSTELEAKGFTRIEQKDRTFGTVEVLIYMAKHAEYHTVKIYRYADTTADPLSPIQAVIELGEWIRRFGVTYGDWMIDNTLESGFLHIYNAH